jgi:hypothetical protein
MNATTRSPHVSDPERWPLRAGPARSGSLRLVVSYPWLFVCAGVLVVGTAAVFWARTSPGYDPYGWLVWGYQTVRLHLDVGGAPSWKPMTWLFTVPYALFGQLAYRLWMITAVTFALGAPIVAGRIVYRLSREGSELRWPAIVGALFAGAALLGIVQYLHYVLSVQSDPMLVTLVLLAIDLHLSGRHRWAFAALWLASLGRPEAWPFVGLYAVWAWRERPQMRKLLVAGLLLIPALWFGIPYLSGNSPFTSANLAQHSPRALHGNKITGTITRFRQLTYWPVFAAAAAGVVLAGLRRNWTVLMIAGAAALWMLVEIAFALHGFPAVPRYMFEAAAATIVLAGVGVGWLLQGFTASTRRAQAAGALVVAVLIGFLVPDAVASFHWEHKDLLHERARTTEIERLGAAITAYGGASRIRYCGQPAVTTRYASVLAWDTKLNVGYVGYDEHHMTVVDQYPAVWFTAVYNGWFMNVYHELSSRQAACASLVNAYYVTTAQHPGGIHGHIGGT